MSRKKLPELLVEHAGTTYALLYVVCPADVIDLFYVPTKLIAVSSVELIKGQPVPSLDLFEKRSTRFCVLPYADISAEQLELCNKLLPKKNLICKYANTLAAEQSPGRYTLVPHEAEAGYPVPGLDSVYWQRRIESWMVRNLSRKTEDLERRMRELREFTQAYASVKLKLAVQTKANEQAEPKTEEA